MKEFDNSNILNVTLEYGQGYDQVFDRKEDELTTNYDYYIETKEKCMEYHIHKIIYTLNENNYIQSLQMIYKNRNNGHLEKLLDTITSHKDNEDKNEIIFEDFEEIILVRFWVKDERLVRFSIKTNMNKIKMIGADVNDGLCKDDDLETEQKIIVGFGVNAGKKYGVSSMYCYYIDKKQFGIYEYDGLLQLRAKLKMNNNFKKEIEKKDNLNEKQKLILETCDLPDTAFFPVAYFIMAH